MQLAPKAMAGIARLLLAAAFTCVDAGTAAVLHQSRHALSPITRVVELLQGMSLKIEADGKAEEKAYDNFVCWATSITSQKRGTNSAAQSRADSLQTYISDLQNGRIELTSERVDLEKDIETLSGDIEIAQQMRQKEAADFTMAKEEMDAAIAALTQAIDVLRTATQGHEDGVLMSLKGAASQTYQMRVKQSAQLSKAVELGNKVLTKGDAVFLQRLLTGDVPERASWKTLNRKATFKMNYKARSFKIQAVLAKLLETFTSNLGDAAQKEEKAIGVFNTLMTAKSGQKDAAQEALGRLDKEGGARGASLADASEERNALLQQISNDEGYISQVATALTNKKSEWKARQELRIGELAAISKAISILHSDDARDLFKKSFASQGFLFLQTSERTLHRAQRALAVLKLAQRQSHDARLANLAALVGSSRFDDVLVAIDSMLVLLRSEEQEDLTNKEQCEADRATDTREAATRSREMDDLTDAITALAAKVAELKAEIKDKEAQIVVINTELSDAATQRGEEHKAYLAAKQDDQDAIGLITDARQVLDTFYKQNGLMFVQDSNRGKDIAVQPVQSVAGEAPPPPPKTWEQPGYGGKTEESTGILAILDMIRDDVTQDIAKAGAEEGDALALYTKTKTLLEGERTELGTAIDGLTVAASTASQSIIDTDQDRHTKKGELTAIMKRISSAAPGCDFITINFQLRSQNRKIEIDGLEKAKAILSGAVFHDLPDPDREIKPGDASLVQGRRKFLRRQS